jgi:hypothetical protein
MVAIFSIWLNVQPAAPPNILSNHADVNMKCDFLDLLNVASATTLIGNSRSAVRSLSLSLSPWLPSSVEEPCQWRRKRRRRQRLQQPCVLFFTDLFFGNNVAVVYNYETFDMRYSTSYADPGLKMRDTFSCATANFLNHCIISIAVLENVLPDAGLQKRATLTTLNVGLSGTGNRTRATCVASSVARRSAIHYASAVRAFAHQTYDPDAGDNAISNVN